MSRQDMQNGDQKPDAEDITEPAEVDDTIVTDGRGGAVSRAGGPDILPSADRIDRPGSEPMGDDEV